MSKHISTHVFAFAACLSLTGEAAHAAVSSMEVAFAIQGNQLTWFGVQDPSIQGTLSDIGLPASFNGNALAYDNDRNRLLFVNGGEGNDRPLWSVSLAGVTLVAGGATDAGPASATGNLTFSTEWSLAGASYYDGSYYAPRQGDTVLRKVDFDGAGNVSGQVNITLPGNANLRLGDMDFDADGGLWVVGQNNANTNRLWYYPNGANAAGTVEAINSPQFYNGIFFNEAKTAMYGYSTEAGAAPANSYGSIDYSDGDGIGSGQMTVLYTGTPFNQGGDLSSGFTMNVDIVPEPGSIALMGLLGSGLLFRRRRS